MQYEISEEERLVLESWYHSAAGESASVNPRLPQDVELVRGLLKKLQLRVHHLDKDIFGCERHEVLK